jgi:molecular chaperone DnaK
VSPADRKEIEAAAAELRVALDAGDIPLIKGRTDALTKAAYRLAEEVYKDASARTQSSTGPSGNGGAGPKKEKREQKKPAEDVDYEVVDDGKKKK